MSSAERVVRLSFFFTPRPVRIPDLGFVVEYVSETKQGTPLTVPLSTLSCLAREFEGRTATTFPSEVTGTQSWFFVLVKIEHPTLHCQVSERVPV